VYVWRVEDGLFFNRTMVAEGYAETLSIAPNDTYRVELSAAAAEARAGGPGLWSACPDDREPGS
jgi:endonuclease YncB( thermonuclease family)